MQKGNPQDYKKKSSRWLSGPPAGQANAHKLSEEGEVNTTLVGYIHHHNYHKAQKKINTYPFNSPVAHTIKVVFFYAKGEPTLH